MVDGNTLFMLIKKHQEIFRATVEDLTNLWNVRDCTFWELSNIPTPKDSLAHNVSVDFFWISTNVLRASSFLTKVF